MEEHEELDWQGENLVKWHHRHHSQHHLPVITESY